MILVCGDSVCWGQGLIEEHKFDGIFSRSKGVPFVRKAHSGAVIGVSSDSSPEVEDGEVPVPSPSLWQQILTQADWSSLGLVLFNGGINDVSLTRILSPLTTPEHLTGLVDQFCYKAMQELLLATASKLTLADAQIAVLGYYPILSSQSAGSETQVQSLLELHGVATSSVFSPDKFSMKDLTPGIVENCITFWKRSNDSLEAAVNAVNSSLGKTTCKFIKAPFTEDNAMWAPNSLLWELNPLLMPEDEMQRTRGTSCEALYGDVADIPQWIVCAHASVGHPNVQGASKIADTLLAEL